VDLNNISAQSAQLSQLQQLSNEQQPLTEILQQLAPLVQGSGTEGSEVLSSLLPQILEANDYAGLLSTGAKSFVDGSQLAWADALSDALPAGQKSAILDQIADLGGTSKALGWAGVGFSAMGILGAEDKTEAVFEAAGSAAGARRRQVRRGHGRCFADGRDGRHCAAGTGRRDRRRRDRLDGRQRAR
jgi:hypothetical protein